MWNLIAIVAIAAAVPGDVTATRLDATAVSGQLQSWSSNGVELKNETDVTTIPLAELAGLELSPLPTTDTGRPLVELVDGSLLPMAEFKIEDGKFNANLPTRSATAALDITIALDKVQAVRIQPLDPAILPQWQEIRATKAPSDLLVLLKRGGKSLDYLEGVIGKVSADEVEFTLGEKTVQVARGKVAGLVFYRGENGTRMAPQCVLHGRDGVILSTDDAALQGDKLHVTTLAGLQLDWPLSEISEADFSAGKIVCLGDLQPASQLWQPLIGLPPGATRSSRFGQPRFNTSAGGGLLSVTTPGDAATGAAATTEEFAKGLVLRSHSEVVYRLPSGFSRFMTVAGIDSTTAANGNVALAIYGDDRLLAEANIAGTSRPLPLELDIAGVKRLKIVVDYGQNLDTGDWLNLGNARLVK